MVELVGGTYDGKQIAVPAVPGRPPPLVLYATDPAVAEVQVIGSVRATAGQDLRYVLDRPQPGQRMPRYRLT